ISANRRRARQRGRRQSPSRQSNFAVPTIARSSDSPMEFSIQLTASAIEDLDFFAKRERRIISGAIAMFLSTDANIETTRRKPLRPNRFAKWELRVRDYRVFYDIAEEYVVKVVAIGVKW